MNLDNFNFVAFTTIWLVGWVVVGEYVSWELCFQLKLFKVEYEFDRIKTYQILSYEKSKVGIIYIKEAGLDKVLEHLTLQERGIEPQFGRVVHQQIIEMLITTIFFLIINPSLYQKGGGKRPLSILSVWWSQTNLMPDLPTASKLRFDYYSHFQKI